MAKNTKIRENSSPMEYLYKEGTKVEVEGQFLYDLISRFDRLLNEEIKSQIPFKYNYVNAETSKIVKKAKQEDIESGKVVKVADNDRMMTASPEFYLTPKGQEYLRLRAYLQSLHEININEGKAIHQEELFAGDLEQSK